MNVVVLTTFLAIISRGSSYNLDYEYSVVKEGPPDSFFGFSVAGLSHGSNNWILVGAPKGDNKYLPQDNSTGTVYKCKATDPLKACDGELPFDSPSGPSESKYNGWLGVSLKASTKNVVSCAHRYTYLHGGKFNLGEGRCFTLNADLDYYVGDYNPCRPYNTDASQTPAMENYGQCFLGIGLDMDINDERENHYRVGAVGPQWFIGRYFLHTDEKQIEAPYKNESVEVERDSYFGYAIAIGDFTKTASEETAVGGPRHKSHGKVLIYNYKLTKEIPTSVAQSVPASNDPFNNDDIQIASGFGIALCALNSDKNSYDELVVGAPFHAADRKTPDVGVVYIYQRSDSSEILKREKTLPGRSAYSNFGYSVANGGDLNLDGYEDLIVGAPHENDGQGAVYLYLGSEKGLLETPSQIIEAKSIESTLNSNPLQLEGFGRSLSAGLDLDTNGYSDVLVGSYISNQAVLLRARPIVTPHCSLTFSPAEINPNEKSCKDNTTFCFAMKFCHNITEPNNPQTSKTIDIEYRIVADSSNRRASRVKFDDTREYTTTVKSSAKTECFNINDLHLVYENGYIAEYPDVTFAAHYDAELKKPPKNGAEVTSLDDYPVLEKSIDGGVLSHVSYTRLSFKRECETCIPDLKISSNALNYTLRLGRDIFLLNVTIENLANKDPAYQVKLHINVPDSITVDSVQDKETQTIVQCNTNKSICERVIEKLASGTKREITIVLNTAEFRYDSAKNMTISVSSVNEEEASTVNNNKIEVIFDAKVVADIEMLGVTATQQIGYKGVIRGESNMKYFKDAGQIVVHKYAVRNNGPDLITSATLTINWPYETLSGKHLLYLLDVFSEEKFKCELPDMNVAGLKSSSSDKNTGSESGTTKTDDSSSRRRREVGESSSSVTTEQPSSQQPTEKPFVQSTEKPTEKRVANKKDGTILSCMRGTAKCTKITCTLKDLPETDSESITIRSILWQPSLFLDYEGEVVTVGSDAQVEFSSNASYISDPNPKNNKEELNTVITSEESKQKDEIAVWIIALAVVAGVILLALLIFGLHKLGFFKRNRSTRRHSAKSKKQEKSLMSK